MQTNESRRSRRATLLRWAGALAAVFAIASAPLVACSNSSNPIDGQGGTSNPPPSTNSCGHPNPGCPCDTPGAEAACGQTQSNGTTTSCMLGTTTCNADGTWGFCDPHRVPPTTGTAAFPLSPAEHAFRGVGPLTIGGTPGKERIVPLAVSMDAGCNDPCDPYCSTFGDNANGADGGPGLADLDGGWTLADVPIPPDAVPPCTGNQCFVDKCSDAGTPTTLSGYVYDPAGNLPISNALVMIPNFIVQPMGQGLGFDPCATQNLPQGLGFAVTDTSGHFVIGNAVDAGYGSVPNLAYPPNGGSDAGVAIPFMVQVGRWRRLTTVSIPNHCTNNDAGIITLPAVQGGTFGQDNIPHIAIVSSSCDPFECMLNDIGIDRTQFSAFNGGGRVEMLWSYNNDPADPASQVNTGGNKPAAILMLPDGGLVDPSTSGFDQLLTSQSVLQNYDLIMLPCRCADEYSNLTNDSKGYRTNVVKYANAGGRVFTSHWGREWIERTNCSTSTTACSGGSCVCYDAGPAVGCSSTDPCNETTQGTCPASGGCSWSGTCSATSGATTYCTAGSSQTLSACTTGTGATDGCQWNGGCSASAAATAYCPAQTNNGQCTNPTGTANGCTWGGGCAVSPNATSYCPAQTNSTGCTTGSGASDGCTWSGGCTPTATATSYCTANANQNVAACTTGSGVTNACNWGAGCDVNPYCAAQTTQANCRNATGVADGCNWGGACTVDPGCTNATNRTQCTNAKNSTGTGDACNAWVGACSVDTACANATSAAACSAAKNSAGTSDACNAWTGTCVVDSACTAATNQNACSLASNASGTNDQCNAWNGSCNVTSGASTFCPAQTTQNNCTGSATGKADGCVWNAVTLKCSAPTCNTAALNADSAQCNLAKGCSFSGTGCTPSATAASCGVDNNDKAACNTVLHGCTFTGAGCTASATSATCGTTTNRNDKNLCNGTQGCTFTGGGCTPSATAATCGTATNTNSEASCNTTAGCTFTGSGCTPSATASTCQSGANSNDKNACTSTTGCVFTGTGCTAPTAACAADANDKNACGSLSYCTFTGSGCAAPAATTCSAQANNSTTCNGTPGCSFTGTGCSVPTTCNGSSQQNSKTTCNGTAGCSFTGTGCTAPNCAANNSSQTACTATAGCTFAGGCTGACSGNTTPSACGAQAGCNWGDAGANWIGYGWIPFPNTAHWVTDNGSPSYKLGSNGNPAFPDSLTTRGKTFTQWLGATATPIPWALVVADERLDIDYVIPPSVRFAYGNTANTNFDASTPSTSGGPNSVLDYTFDTPLDASTQPGRVMFTDMHLAEQTQLATPPTTTISGTAVPIFNTSYTANGGQHECQLPEAGLNAQERVAEYLLFDLGACGAQGLPPTPVPPHWYGSQTFSRDYCVAPSTGASTGGCPNLCSNPNQSVVWRGFQWTAFIPGESDGGTWGDSGLGPSIQFYATTAGTQSQLGVAPDAGGPQTYLLANDTTSGTFNYDVSQSISPDKSATWLRITMVMNPDSTNQIAPILTSWQQVYDCVDSQ